MAVPKAGPLREQGEAGRKCNEASLVPQTEAAGIPTH